MRPELPRRFLFVIHTRWSRDLGAPKVQLELGEALSELGCSWEKFSWEDAFPDGPATRYRLARRLRDVGAQNRSFSRRAIDFVRRNADRFDVVEAHQTDLPVTKRQLRFKGLLVARSVGFIPSYEAFDRFAASRWPRQDTWRTRLESLLSLPARRRRRRELRPSLDAADLITVPNRDEHRLLSQEWGYGNRVVHVPIGLPPHRLLSLAGAAEFPGQPRVVFVGTWNERKGSRDWPAIVARVQQSVPEATFRFLGTSIPAETVLAAFGERGGAVEVVPSFRAAELPGLLAGARVAGFPGYLEGFGISVLETLAAGLPTVVYDAPGPRDIVAPLAHPRLVPLGDVNTFADDLVHWLRTDGASWRAAADDARRGAATFDTQRIAEQTLALYADRWKGLRP
jgi:glycosyltransferase involved in cell wall biosynthesis